MGLGPEIPAIAQAGLLTATRVLCVPFAGGGGSCMCWECPVMNSTAEAPRLGPIQAPEHLPATLSPSAPASQGQAGTGLWHQDQAQHWVTCPSSASACQHHLPPLPGPRQAQRALYSDSSGSQTRHQAAQGHLPCPPSSQPTFQAPATGTRGCPPCLTQSVPGPMAGKWDLKTQGTGEPQQTDVSMSGAHTHQVRMSQMLCASWGGSLPPLCQGIVKCMNE